jgi:glycosyltransferase involved in cell wall biosynthesis
MKVSVVVTCYNYGRYLKTCIDSVLAQTYQDLEIVLIDDGSTDDTAAVAACYAAEPRFRVYHQPNQGQTVAKNKGIELSRGELVAFLDADDFWLPEKLARQLPLFDDPGVGVTYTGFGFIDVHNRRIPSDAPHGYLSFQRGRVTRWLGFDNFVPFSTTMVRRSLFDTHGGFDETLRLSIDWELWLRLSTVTRFDFVADELIAYRVGHADQMSKNKAGRFAAADVIFQRFLERYPDAISADDVREIEFWNAHSRAAAFRQIDWVRSTALLIKAWRLRPWSGAPYRGMLRNARALMSRPAS